jgi:hypothetical protein
MKTFKLRNNKTKINGVTYSSTPAETPVKIKGMCGNIHSISIAGKVMYPISGIFTN